MKFIFSFLFGILILSPTFASYECTENTSEDQCTCAGWGYGSWGCEECGDKQYSPSGDSACYDCVTCDINNNCSWITGVPHPNNSTFDTTNTQTGQPSCPWVCNDGYFDDTEHKQCLFCPTNTSGFMSYPNGEAPTSNCANSCSGGKYIIDTLESANSTSHRYYCGTCGLGTQSSNGAVSTCTCYNAPGVNRVYGGGPNRTTNRIECECTAGATWQDGACKCGVNTYLTPTNDGYICQSCPTHSSTLQQIGKTSPDECLCEAGYYMSGNTCKSCPEHASCTIYGKTYENVQCASGYQKNSRSQYPDLCMSFMFRRTCTSGQQRHG